MIYFDNAATTPVLEKCIEIVNNYNTRCFFNPSARYYSAVNVHKDITLARETLADILGCSTGEIFYTSSGSESDNWAIKGVMRKPTERLIVSESEHPAVYNTALALKNAGFDVQFCKVLGDGSIDILHLESLLTKNTKLVSIMHVNNETGVINDIANLVKLVKSKTNALFHSDGVQAFGKIRVDVETLGVDMYSISGHKINAPKGIAALYVKKGVNIIPLIHGGGQENNYRSSTENVSGIVALSTAAREADSYLKMRDKSIFELRKFIIDNFVLEFGDKIRINTNVDKSTPFILNLSIKGVRGEVLLHSLEKDDIYISTGSACSSKKGVSRLVSVLNIPEDFREGTIRLSFSRNSTIEEGRIFVEKAIAHIYELLRFRRK